MSNLLLDEYPLIVLPTLATLIGLNEAIVLQQINYWLNNPQIHTADHFFKGLYWIYNSYPEWKKQLPFFSERTIQRVLLNLQKKGLILSGNFSKDPMKRSKWYTINFDALETLIPYSTTTRHIGTMHTTKVVLAPRQSGTMQHDKVALCYTETTTETTKDLTNVRSKNASQGKATLLGGEAILTDEYRQVAMERGIHSDWIDLRWKDFKDYWTSGGTAKYFKKDWLATWRNNCSAATSKFMYPCPAGVGGSTVSSGSAESTLVFNEGNVEYASETPDGPKRIPLYADPTIGGAFRRYDKQGIEWNYTYGQWRRTGRRFMNDLPAQAAVYANLPSMSGGFDDD